MAQDDLPLKLIFTRWYNSIREWILDDINQMLANTIVGGKLVGSKLSGTIPSTVIKASLPLTTKGDLLTYGTGLQRHAVGANTYVLTADSTQTDGVNWLPVSGTGSSTLAGDTDVSISSPAISDHLIYQTSDSKWHNHAEVFNILADGADPTGVNDSSSAFQTRINAILGGSVTGVILVPPGTYKMSSTVTATTVSTSVGVRILAHGATFKPANSVTCFHAVGGVGAQLFGIEGANFDGTGTTGTSAIIIENVQSWAYVHDCWFNKLATYGVEVLNSGSAGNFCEGVTFRDSNWFQCGTGIAFTRTGGDVSQGEFVIDNCGLSECTTGILFDGGVNVYRGRMDKTTIWTQPGDTGININNADVRYNTWEVRFEGFSGGGTNMVVGTVTSSETLEIHTGFEHCTVPGFTNPSGYTLTWYVGPQGYSWGTSQQVWAGDTTDTQPRLRSDMGFSGGGGLWFGPGGSTAVDTSLFRKAVKVLTTNGAFVPASFTTSTVPSASSAGAGALAWITDAPGGAAFEYSDGVSWNVLVPTDTDVRWEPLVNNSSASPPDFIVTNGDIIVAAD